MPKRFDEKVVWITGAGSGIGRAMAHEFARQGAHIALSGRREDRLQLVAEEVQAIGTQGVPFALDVTDDAAIARTVAAIEERFARLDVVVANAGYAVAGKFERVSTEEWRRQLDVNVVGLAATVRAALPLIRTGSGRIALIGSVSAMVPTRGNVAYTASKYAVRAIGQTLSIELAGSGVSCTTLHPGFVESEIAQVNNAGQYNADREDRRPKNLMWTADEAAKVCVRAIARRKRELVFTGHGKVGAFLGQHFPGLAHFAMTRQK